jgi:Protein of unknown function (DUF3313)
MNPTALVVIPVVLLASQAYAGAVSDVGRQAAQEGLAAAHSRYLDKVYLRPELNLSAYRAVMIDPVRVDFDERWLRDSGYAIPPVGDENLKRIAESIALEAQASIAEAFRDHGFAISSTAGAGVLRLAPHVSELYVNAPERRPPWNRRTFTYEAGEATLVLEARDSTTDTVVARMAHRGTATQMGRFTWATDVTNQIWFGELIRRWAAECAAKLETGPK